MYYHIVVAPPLFRYQTLIMLLKSLLKHTSKVDNVIHSHHFDSFRYITVTMYGYSLLKLFLFALFVIELHYLLQYTSAVSAITVLIWKVVRNNMCICGHPETSSIGALEFQLGKYKCDYCTDYMSIIWQCIRCQLQCIYCLQNLIVRDRSFTMREGQAQTEK